GPPQSRGGSPFCSDNTFSPRARTLGGAADILPARPPRQENRKSMTRAAQSLCARFLATPGTNSLPPSCSASLLTALARPSAVIQVQANVGVFFEGQPGWNRRDLPSHPQMHKQRRRRGVSICGSTRLLVHRRQPQQHEFAVTLDGLDLTTRQMLFQRGRVVDKV